MIESDIWNFDESHLRNFIASKVPESVVDDLFQEVNLVLVEKFNKKESVKNPQSYSFQIARNKIADYYKKKHKSMEFEKQFASIMDDEFEPCVCDIIEVLIKKMIPEKYSQPFILSDIYKTPQKEIAEQLSLTYENTKSRIQRGRQTFKKEVEKFADLEYNENGHFVKISLKNKEQIPAEIIALVKDLKIID